MTSSLSQQFQEGLLCLSRWMRKTLGPTIHLLTAEMLCLSTKLIIITHSSLHLSASLILGHCFVSSVFLWRSLFKLVLPAWLCAGFVSPGMRESHSLKSGYHTSAFSLGITFSPLTSSDSWYMNFWCMLTNSENIVFFFD